MPVKQEYSAGGVVYQKFQIPNSKYQIKWLIGKHSGYHKWVLPKGLIEEGERGMEAAVRETEEEMGVKARVIGERPIHKEEYWFVATLDKKVNSGKQKDKPIRRVKVYQEEPGFGESKEEKVRVLKTVSFYLMEYESGDPEDHDWEMEDAGWYGFEEAVEMLAFAGERAALDKAREMVEN